MTPPRASGALPPGALHEAVPKGISGRASYLHVCLAFHSVPQVIATFFNRLPFGPPRGLTRASTCPWQDHIGFGSAACYCSALFRLGFPPAPGLQSLGLAAHGNSQAYSTKDTPQVPPPRHLVGPWFQVLFHSPSRGSFRLSLTVLLHYRWMPVFSLGSWSTRIQTGFLVPRPTQVPHHGGRFIPATGLSPSSAELSGSFAYEPTFSLHGSSPCGPSTPPSGGLGSSAFARRYLRNLF